MLKISHLRHLFLATLLSISFTKIANAETTTNLTVSVKGIRHQKGEICFRVFAGEQGFPMSNTSEIQSGCAKIVGNSVSKTFSGLKPGTYAVAVVDDQNGDRKLNTDFLGIPKEGFGLSKNPTVSMLTGTPKFRDASFAVNQNTKIDIFLKYSLDP